MFTALYAPGNLPLLLECARRFSPLVEVTSADLVTFDIQGLQRLFGTPADILKEIERTVGLPADLAIAANPDVAIYVCRGKTGGTLIPSGMEAQALAPLSLHLLGCPAEVASLLDLWGLRTFGQFAQLPPLGVAARLGEEGVYWQRQAQGNVTRQLRLWGETVHFHKEVELEDSIGTLEPLLFLLGKMLFELCIELTARSLSTNQLRVCLTLEGHADHLIRVQLPVPMSDRQTLLKLLNYEMEQHPAPALIQRVRLELEPVAPRRTQEHLFTPAYPFPEELELTIARVRRIVGAENVGTPVLLDTHRPDSFVMKPFASFASSAQSELEKPEKPTMLAYRRFRPPPPAQIKTEQQPVHIASKVVQGVIALAKGPWYTSGDWWLQNPWQREEWDIGLQKGGLYKIYRDLETMSWFVDGNYD